MVINSFQNEDVYAIPKNGDEIQKISDIIYQETNMWLDSLKPVPLLKTLPEETV